MTEFAGYLKKNDISLSTDDFLIPISPEAKSTEKSPLFLNKGWEISKSLEKIILASRIGGQAYIFRSKLKEDEYCLRIRLVPQEGHKIKSEYLEIYFAEDYE